MSFRKPTPRPKEMNTAGPVMVAAIVMFAVILPALRLAGASESVAQRTDRSHAVLDGEADRFHRTTAIRLAQRTSSDVDRRSSLPTGRLPRWDRRVFDVFFEDAFAHLGSGDPPSPSDRPLALAGESAPGDAMPDSANAPGSEWKAIVSGEALEDEVKRQMPALTAAVRSLSAFKSEGAQVIRRQFSLLAVVFAVISQHDEDVRWKTEAAELSKLLARCARNAKTSSSATFNEAKQRVQDLADLVRGGSITLPEAAEANEAAPLASRRQLMLRMEESHRERLEQWTASDRSFSSNQEDIDHEAQILAMLTRVILSPEYEYSEDNGYREYAGALIESCNEIRRALELNQFEQARSAVGTITKSCDNCHVDYRG